MIFKVVVLSVMVSLVAANTLEQDHLDIQNFNSIYGGVCTREFEPICGSDGRTYGNVCQFQNARKSNGYLYPAAIGMCSDVNACSPYRASTTDCATKQNAILKKLYRLNCKGCNCNRMWKPVCGSDRQTYGNVCEFKCQQTNNKSLMLIWPGECTNFRANGIVSGPGALLLFNKIFDQNCTMSS